MIHTGLPAELLSGLSVAATDLDCPVVAAGNRDDLLTVADVNAMVADVIGGPGKVVGILFARRREAAAVDKV